MTVEIRRETLLWCTLLNFELLALWAGFLILAHDWDCRLHSRWFNL